jgi:murein DD-endopeptidase MepM/ murein hydrolase activator NlpD
MRLGKNLLLLGLIVLSLGIYVNTANAFLLDFFFGQKASNTSTDLTKVQTMDVLGEGNLNGKKNSNNILKKLFNEESSAFSIEQGSLHNSVDKAVEEENSHSMDEIAVYTVQKGDSLASIASYFEVSIDTIITFNKLEVNKVKEGDVLEIPQISGILYTIKKGDTLEKLSSLYKVDSEDISLYNALIPELGLTLGEDIFLPGAKLSKVEEKIVDKNKDKKKTFKDSVAKAKKNGTSDVSAITKIKRFAGKYANLPVLEGYFGNPAPSAKRTQRMHGANGVDLAAAIGSDIFAAAAGSVSVARSTGWNYGYGQYIVITHPNGTQTVYAHLSNIDVVVGQTVSRGQKIADMGNTGNSTGPHLHFEVRGAYNPFAW